MNMPQSISGVAAWYQLLPDLLVQADDVILKPAVESEHVLATCKRTDMLPTQLCTRREGYRTHHICKVVINTYP
jgi:hypothetical protein